MPDLTVPAVLFALVLLILLGQWIMVRRAKSTQGMPAPVELLQCCTPVAQNAPENEGVFFFEAPGCMACRRMAPILETVLKDHPVHLCVINVQEKPELARTLRIMGTPTIILVHEGNIVQVIVGGISPSKLQTHITQYWPQSNDLSPDSNALKPDPHSES
ncbi:MAG: thioredoxin family protein [Halothiobacillus sp.]|jgi:thioredoxin 1|nr:thioredoxin family protein [Halothiobacillus sp.]